MIKFIVTLVIWIASFMLMLPSDKPNWMGLLAAVATYQVMAALVNDLYDILLSILEVVSLDALRKLEQDKRLKDEDE